MSINKENESNLTFGNTSGLEQLKKYESRKWRSTDDWKVAFYNDLNSLFKFILQKIENFTFRVELSFSVWEMNKKSIFFNLAFFKSAFEAILRILGLINKYNTVYMGSRREITF